MSDDSGKTGVPFELWAHVLRTWSETSIREKRAIINVGRRVLSNLDNELLAEEQRREGGKA